MAPSNESGANSAQASGGSSSDTDLAQAYRDLTRGEQTAAALEANLSHLEDKLEAILAALEANEAEQLKAPKPNKADNNGKTLSGNGPAEDDADKGKTA